jgi:hypothetical protein
MRKKKEKSKFRLILISLVLVTIILSLCYIFAKKSILELVKPGITTTTLYIRQSNCGDLHVSIDSIKEAIAYYRFGIQKPAAENYKFEIMKITVTNVDDVSKDFSGYRLQLVAGNKSYSPVIFHSIEKITQMDNSVIDYSCDELSLAYISRFELGAGESSTGCKIFRIQDDAIPVLLLIYNTTGLKCSIRV